MGQKATIYVSVMLVVLLLSGSSFAGLPTGEDSKLPIVLQLTGEKINSQLVDITYEINYPGFLEFHLFDDAGKRIFLTSMVKPKGKHAMKLKKSKLGANRQYRYFFIYKGKEYHGEFSV